MNWQWENDYILALIQALYGAVSQNLRAVKVSNATENSLAIHFLLENESGEDREEIGDVIFEFEALLSRGLKSLDVEIVVGSGSDVLATLPGRGVFHRKEVS